MRLRAKFAEPVRQSSNFAAAWGLTWYLMIAVRLLHRLVAKSRLRCHPRQFVAVGWSARDLGSYCFNNVFHQSGEADDSRTWTGPPRAEA